MMRCERGKVQAVGRAMALLALGMVLLRSDAVGQLAPSFETQDFGVVPRPAMQMVLLSLEPVQDELKITAAQKTEQQAIQQRMAQRLQQARRAAAGGPGMQQGRLSAA